MNNHHHSELEDDVEERTGLADPASSHGSDLDARMTVDSEPEGEVQEHTGLGHSASVPDEQSDEGTEAGEASP